MELRKIHNNNYVKIILELLKWLVTYYPDVVFTQPSVVPGAKACLTARKVVRCTETEKACKGP